MLRSEELTISYCSMETKYLDFNTEVKALSNRQFEAYGAVFGNVDHHNEVILKGAFLDSLTRRMPKLAYQHDVKRLPGVIKAATEDSKGLLITGEFIDTTLGNDVYQEVKSGAIDKMSIGFSVRDEEYNDKGVRILKQIELYEVSFVTFPANEQAGILNVKDIDNIRDFEKFLCKSGFSKERAKAIASVGFKQKGTERDAGANSHDTECDAEVKEITTLLNSLTNKIKQGVKNDGFYRS